MSSTDDMATARPLHCEDCNEPVRKTASGAYVCTGCSDTSTTDSGK